MAEHTWRELFDRAADHGVSVANVQDTLAARREDDS